ncbi:hypothetical protein LshimejAT787_0400840 [Lyophyllum shimeji]|uniref:Uncharacterized protein n=1 Tax=Lyophyllum shimeji TaxID=47721 RepID=A0A9P3PJD8_LYOSH|nr:hypothetical protein LshimejAT787_0400840 [Lyophyllum shimeji]
MGLHRRLIVRQQLRLSICSSRNVIDTVDMPLKATGNVYAALFIVALFEPSLSLAGSIKSSRSKTWRSDEPMMAVGIDPLFTIQPEASGISYHP